MLVICGLKYCRTGISTQTLGLDMGDAVEGGGIGVTGMFQGSKPVGRSVDGREGTEVAGTETDALYLMHRCKEDAPGALALQSLALCIEDTHGEVELAVLGIQCCLKTIGLVCLIRHHIAISRSVLHTDHSFFVQFDAGASDALLIEEFNLQGTVTGLSCLHIEGCLQIGRRRNLALYTGIVKRIFIFQFEPLLTERNRCHQRRIDIPSLEIAEFLILGEIIIGMGSSHGLDRNGYMRHPDIFLVHGIAHPHIGILRNAIAFLNATDILRTATLIVATVSHRWYFATNQIQCLVFQTVTTQRDAQRPAVF